MRNVIEDICQFEHLDKEGALAARQVIERPDAGKDTVDDPDARVPGRHETAGLRHDADERCGPHVRGLPGHVCAGDDQDLVLTPREFHVIGNKSPGHTQLHHGMTAIADDDSIAGIQVRAHVIPAAGNFCKGGGTIKGGDAHCDCLKIRHDRP